MDSSIMTLLTWMDYASLCISVLPASLRVRFSTRRSSTHGAEWQRGAPASIPHLHCAAVQPL
jgi:hypothetical protein